MTRKRGSDASGRASASISLSPGNRGYGRVDRDALSFHPERLLLTEESDDSDPPVDPEAWFVEAADLFAEAFCLTLVKAVPVEEVFGRLEVEATSGRGMTFDDLVTAAYDNPSEPHGRQLVGGCELDGWTLLVEPNGYGCTQDRHWQRLSENTTAVTMYLNVNAANEFSVSADGVQLLRFDMMFPDDRDGDRPDAFLEDMLAVGIGVDMDEEDDEAEDADPDGLRWIVAGAELVERLTGVRLTIGLLHAQRYRTGLLRVG